MSNINDYPVGTYVESSSEHEFPFVGHVVGLTVNPFGEPILVIHMTSRVFPFIKNEESRACMMDLGWSPLEGDSSYTFWERVGTMHPANVRKLNSKTFLFEQ